MKIKKTVLWLGSLPFKAMWACFTLYLYILTEIIQFLRSICGEKIRQFVYYCKQQSFIAYAVKFFLESVNRFWNWIRWWIASFNQQNQINRRSFLRQRQSEQQITTMLERAEANPTDITQNEKVLMLMQKMRKLQQIIFQQSSDRRKAENQLHELQSQLTKKNALLIKERSQSVQNLQKINLLSSQLKQKQQLVKNSKEQIEGLQQQLEKLKKLIQQRQKLNQQEVKQDKKELQEVSEQKNQQNQHQSSAEASNEAQKQQIEQKHQQNGQSQNLVIVKKAIVSQNKKKKKKIIANN